MILPALQVVSPGDILAQLPAQGEVKIGAGIRANGPHLQTLRAGILRHTKSGKLWVEGRQKRCAASGARVFMPTQQSHSSDRLAPSHLRG